MKGAVVTLLVTVTGMAALVGLFAWTPWDDERRERELAWVERLAAWAESSSSDACALFDQDVGQPPTKRLAAAGTTARAGCGRLDDPQFVRWEVSGRLIDGHREVAQTTYEADLSRIAETIAGRRPRAHCWTEDEWGPMAEQHSLLYGDDFWVAGIATPTRGRIDLAPEVCDPLRRFLREEYSPWLSTETLDLSSALLVLAHEAEHLRVPQASEAEVECYALQRVRAMAGDAGRGPRYQEEMALLAWDLGYPNLPPEYRTKRCRDGGPLDLRRETSVWP
jgi:hypothetical protein